MRLFLFFAFMIYAGKRAHGCGMKFTPPMVYLEFGGSTVANCNTSCSSVDGIGWESSFGGTGLKEGLTTLDVNLDNVNDWETEPKCYTVFSNGSQDSQKLPITIYKMPTKVSMPKPLSPLMADDKYHLLKCSVFDVAPVNRLIISWYKGDKMFHEQKFEGTDRHPVNRSVEATVDIVAEDNRKKVWCEAKLDLPAKQRPQPMRSELHELTVYYPPTLTEPKNETLENVTGTKISLNCTATGNPTPHYEWHFANSTLKWTRDQNATGPILTLDFRTPGVWKCVASNVVDKTTKYFHLNKPKDNYTTMAALLGVFLTLGIVIIILGAVFVTRSGSCTIPRTIY
ncbi:PREDICTED: intercellular adhesion molecule 3-like [Poecilia mexicana]|uniref:Ig-like domain-containing protein n=1 Tax=Poecilia mexicana TaxID=48701 RepID=A0A3B3YII9_9TELE|nr:PREDICTED: intercellular adhesion molecule 3-like [Poecilia mexicana]